MHTDFDRYTALPVNLDIGTRTEDAAVYSRFMRHLYCVPNRRMEIKILSAIQFTADMMNHSDAHISKILVDMGLRAPRMAFPAEFLRYADQALMRAAWDVGAPGAALIELRAHWDVIGDDKSAAFKGDYAPRAERVGV